MARAANVRLSIAEVPWVAPTPEGGQRK